MIKWILGGLVVIILALAGTCYVGYQKLTSGGDSVTMMFAATPEAIFAQIATPDSMALWVESSSVHGPFGRGPLVVGDTLLLDSGADASISTSDSNGVKVSRRPIWIVQEVNAPTLLVTEMRVDSAGASRVMLVRRDAIMAHGDSTMLTSTFEAPLFDAISSSVGDSSKIGKSILGASSKLMIGGMRLTVEADLKKLKARIEGTTPK